MHDVSGNLNPGIDLKSEIIKLSITNGILSKYTAFIAVEQRSESTAGAMKLRNISLNPIYNDEKQKEKDLGTLVSSISNGAVLRSPRSGAGAPSRPKGSSAALFGDDSLSLHNIKQTKGNVDIDKVGLIGSRKTGSIKKDENKNEDKKKVVNNAVSLLRIKLTCLSHIKKLPIHLHLNYNSIRMLPYQYQEN